jgi:hypothetical protein
MSGMGKTEELITRIKELCNEHFTTPEVQSYLNTRFDRARVRCWAIHQAHFVRNRRDCWALAMGQAPLDVKREIWLHEQDELVSDPRADGEDHYALAMKEAALFGLSSADIEQAKLHPFVSAALEAWLHLGKKSWLESFTAVSVVEAVNSDTIISGGGFSFRFREKLMSELGFRKEVLKNRNVHVEADKEHTLILDTVLIRHARSDFERKLVMDAVENVLVIDRAYRGGLGFAMQQIPLEADGGAVAAR